MADGASYGGQTLALDFDRAIATLVARRWPESRWPTSCGRLDGPLRANPFANRSIAGRFASPYPDVPAPRVNEVIVPTGAARYARGLFLIGGDELDALASSSASAASVPPESCAELLPLVIEYGGTRFEWQMAKLTPILVDATGGDALWLLPLVDERYFWRQYPAAAAVAMNDSWTTLFTSLGAAIGQSLSPGSVGGAHGYPDIETFADAGISAAQAIDAAALSLGLRAVMASDGTLSLKTASASDATLTANLSAATPWLGGEVEHYGLCDSVSLISRQAYDLYGLLDETAVTTAGADAACSLSEAVIHTPRWLEFYEDEEDVDSRNRLTALASAIASSIAAWGNKQHAMSVPGVAAWTICGHDDYKSIYVPGTDRFEAVSTHIASLPSDFYPLVHLGNVDYRLNFSRVRGNAISDFAPGDEIEIETLIGMDGTTAGITRTLTVDNTHDWEGTAGAMVRAEYNETERAWEAYQVDCPSTGG